MTERGQRPPGSFGDLRATALFCRRCQTAQPVRDRLLLVLPDGELFEYSCRHCGATVGHRKVTEPPALTRH